MALFTKKTWKDRLVEYAGRRKLVRVSGDPNATMVVDVARNEGNVSQAGDAFSATNMNDLETRISNAIGTGDIPAALGNDIISAITALNTGIKDKMYSIGTSKPTSGYIVYDDSYIHRSPFGQIDIYIHIAATAVNNVEHIIGFIPEGYRPTEMRELLGSMVRQDGTFLGTIAFYIYPNGNISVVNPHETGSYVFSGYGSYFI